MERKEMKMKMKCLVSVPFCWLDGSVSQVQPKLQQSSSTTVNVVVGAINENSGKVGKKMSCFSCCRVEVQHRTGSLKESAYGIVGNGSNNNGKSLRSLVNSLSSRTGNFICCLNLAVLVYVETLPHGGCLNPCAGSSGKQKIAEEIQKVGNAKISAHVFTFRELVAATDNFNPACLIGEGGFGRVYKGYIDNIDKIVAVKQLDWNGLQGSREFFSEVLMLSFVNHPNLVNLVGYCADGDQRILVYEYMANGSLENHLLDLPPGQLTTKSDVYSFGVVFLELISGRRAIDILRPEGEQNLAEPLLKDRHKFTMIADPLLEDNYPVKALYQALAVAAMCLQEDADCRPLMGDVVTAVEFLAKPKDNDRTAAESQRNTGLHLPNHARIVVCVDNCGV
ncbi:hypothetical protein GQ457_14G010830 [Hibiscus cannabinus]